MIVRAMGIVSSAFLKEIKMEEEQTEKEGQETEPEYPRWIKEKENCLWCNRPAPLIGIEPLDTDQGLRLRYKCNYDDCDRFKRFRKRAIYGLCLEDPHYFLSYEEWKKKKKEEAEKKSDETAVPISINGKGEDGV